MLKRALAVDQQMDKLYPAAETALVYQDAFSLLIAVILSAQTTDVAVNQVTPELFARWPDAAGLAQADPAELAEIIRRIGFFRVKARHCIQTAQIITAEHAGQVPDTMSSLTRLPGVGRKTANIVLNHAFGIVEGIAVDTHVFRIAHRLRFSPEASDSPTKVEKDLLQLYPENLWGGINHRWVLFFFFYCRARQPRCNECPLAELCPTALK
jgi:endonuclease-3